MLFRKKKRPDIKPSFEAFAVGAFQNLLDRTPSDHELKISVENLRGGLSAADFLERLRSSSEAQSKLNGGYGPMHVSPGHFYSPIPPASDIERHLNSIEDNPISVFGVDLRSDDILRMWKDLTPFMLDCPFPEQPTPPYRYCFSAIPYSWGDALVYHAMLRRFRPSKVIEIGSGWSTACALDTNKHFLNGETEIKCIEPYPITVRHALKEDISSVTLIESDLQKVPISEFSSLKANDILFIDSTHVLRTGSDVAYEFLEVLPRLVPGVVVHIHDIFWPFEYPRDWLINEKRAWNELYLVRLMLLQSDRWEVLMFNDYMGKQYHDVVQRSVPNFLRNPGGGLWLLSK